MTGDAVALGRDGLARDCLAKCCLARDGHASDFRLLEIGTPTRWRGRGQAPPLLRRLRAFFSTGSASLDAVSHLAWARR